jgi:broad specificity phosphatase PhoE
MASIYLIRHGQASFGKADYDQLSPKGCQQSEILGKHMGSFIDARKCFSGDLLRHGQTLQHFSKGANQVGIPIGTHSGFNEYDHLEILARNNFSWEDVVKKTTELGQKADANKILHGQFSTALQRWVNSEKNGTCDEYAETWTQFKQRCVGALKDVIKQYQASKSQAIESDSASTTKSKDILVFTSGGPIAVIIQHVLNLTDEQALDMNQQCRNTSVTKLLFSGNKLSIDYYNNYSHLELEGPEWPTFR